MEEIEKRLQTILVKTALQELEKDDNITFSELCTKLSSESLSAEDIKHLLAGAGFKWRKSMQITVTFTIHGCKGCPYLTTGKTYGNDGRDGSEVFICSEGVYGDCIDTGYWTGLDKIPNVTPQDCPYNK